MRKLALRLLLLAATASCSLPHAAIPPEGGEDAASDASDASAPEDRTLDAPDLLDARPDRVLEPDADAAESAAEAPPESAPEAGPESAPEAGPESGPEASADVLLLDARPDALDAAVDAPSEAAADAAREAGADAPLCSSEPVTSCSGACSPAGYCLFDGCVAVAQARRGPGAYWLRGDATTPAWLGWCDTDLTTPDRSWTLALAVDGASSTFAYGSSAWDATTVLNASPPTLTRGDARLGGYWLTTMSEVRVQLRDPTSLAPLGAEVVGLLPTPLRRAGSLRALLSAGSPVDLTYAASGSARSLWLAAVTGSSLQANCNDDGLDRDQGGARVRLGILANEQRDCNSPDSWLGVGGDYAGVAVTAGNVARYNGTGDRTITAQAFVWVR